MEPPLGQVGKILASKRPAEVGTFVEIVDDAEGPTGGAFIFTLPPNSKEVFDDWLPSIDDAAAFIVDCGWGIDWSAEVPPDVAVRRPRHP